MSKRIFTKEEIERLLSNPHVANCGERSVTYSQEFKMDALSLYDQGLTSTEIFTQAGLSLDLIGKDQPQECLGRWRRIVKKKGIEGLAESRGQNAKGGGRPKIKGVSDADRIEYLETQIAYLKAENAFLAKLRAKRRE